MNQLPGWMWVAEIAMITGAIAGVCAILYRGAPGSAGVRLAAGAGVGLGGWLVLSGYLAGAGVYRGRPGELAPAVGIALAAALAALLLAVRLPAVAASLSQPDAVVRLTALQGFRVIGGLFLVAMALGELPAVFALPAGLGDIAVGVAAPFVAARLARNPGHRAGAVGFHLLGLLDLVVAISIGVLAAPGALQVLATTPGTEQLTALPLTLVPTVAVPLAVAAHLMALRRLRAPVAAPAPTPTPSPAT